MKGINDQKLRHNNLKFMWHSNAFMIFTLIDLADGLKWCTHFVIHIFPIEKLTSLYFNLQNESKLNKSLISRTDNIAKGLGIFLFCDVWPFFTLSLSFDCETNHAFYENRNRNFDVVVAY